MGDGLESPNAPYDPNAVFSKGEAGAGSQATAGERATMVNSMLSEERRGMAIGGG